MSAVPTSAATGPVEAGRVCLRCGYSLEGLSAQGRCPECGAPVADSLRGNLLRYSSPEYLAKLHWGVFLVLVAIIGSFLVTVAAIAFGIVVAPNRRSFTGGHLSLRLLATATAAVSIWGWWLFTAPDPAYAGLDKGTTARKLVRVAVIVIAAAALYALVVDLLYPSLRAGAGRAVALPLWGLFVFVVMTGAYVLQFFAAMLYVKWIAPRIPSERVAKGAGTLMWLGPVLFTVGLLCLLSGPLIAEVLYWGLLNLVRMDLKRIRQERQDEPVVG